MIASYGLSSLGNVGPHGYSEVLYNFTTAAANDGRLSLAQRQHPWYNLAIGS